jgi:hypothetical protein
MPLYSTACPLPLNRKISRHRVSGGGFITTSRAFNSSGIQVGTTNTGDIPISWVQNQTTVTSVIFANNNSVTSIGNSAFQACTSLSSITIPSSVTSIGSYAFRFCSSFTSITIPSGVTSIGSYAFDSCGNLTSVTFTPTSSVTSISSYAFSYSGLTSITIPNSVLTIGIRAFAECDSLTNITIPNNVTTIGEETFLGCNSLTTATIGTGVTNIEGGVFRSCDNLATVLCRVPQSAFTGIDAFFETASPLVIQARITDTSWTAGVGLTFQGNTNVTVIKTL